MIQTSQELFDLLKNGVPHREVYRGHKGGWFVSYGGGEVDADIVGKLVNQGLVKAVYSDCPNDCYHIGETVDVDKVLEERKRIKNVSNAKI